MNPCINCACAYACKLKDPNMSQCPIFENPPQEKPQYEQPQLPWDAKEGCYG